MNTATTLETLSTGSADTERIAEKLGSRCRGGEVVELVSDLGGGKTTFVRGLARGIGSQDHVSSPTFKISNIYKAKDLELHHFDFYRLPEAGIIADELAEVIGDPNIVVAIEWGAVIHDVLPPQRLTVNIAPTDENTRILSFAYAPSLQYMLEGIKH